MASYVVLIILAILFALNMGASNFAASFAAAYGAKIVTKRKAFFLFIIFVFLGAVLLGGPVAKTLGSKLIPVEFLNKETLIIILVSTTTCLFLANRLHIPQSTSFVTVAAIAGVGVYFKKIQGGTFLYLIPFWILLPILGYLITYLLAKLIYPPKPSNFWVYEKLVNHTKRLKLFVIAASCYNAFSVGTNNVANVVGPLAGAGIVDKLPGLAMASPVFGLGGAVFQGPLNTTSEKIVPLGLFSATIVCLVSATLMIIASVCGVPQSFVMIKLGSVFAISGVKNGHRITFNNPIIKKMYITWAITPIAAFCLSYLLTGVRYGLFK